MKLARFTSRYAIWIVVVWLVGAGAANLVVPQLEHVVQGHSRSFLPADAPSSVAAAAAAELFGEQRSNNFNFIVLERDRPLNEQDRQFYDELIATLRADTRHVIAAIGVGLLLDTLIVRTFVLPSVIALLGRWFWGPSRASVLTHRRGVNGLGRQRLRDHPGDLLDRRRAGSLRQR